MITSNDEELIKKCSSLRNRGIDLDCKGEQFSLIGSNNRMTEFAAILGLSQLGRVDEFNLKRNKLAKVYNQLLKPLLEEEIIYLPNFSNNVYHTYWRYWLRLKHPSLRKKIKSGMSKARIDIDWAYSPLLHLQPVFKKIYRTVEITT